MNKNYEFIHLYNWSLYICSLFRWPRERQASNQAEGSGSKRPRAATVRPGGGANAAGAMQCHGVPSVLPVASDVRPVVCVGWVTGRVGHTHASPRSIASTAAQIGRLGRLPVRPQARCVNPTLKLHTQHGANQPLATRQCFHSASLCIALMRPRMRLLRERALLSFSVKLPLRICLPQLRLAQHAAPRPVLCCLEASSRWGSCPAETLEAA